MNILKRYTIPYKGLGRGGHHFEFDVDDAIFRVFEGSEITGGKAHVEVELERAASVLTLGVTIKGRVTIECDRCLDSMELPVDYDGTLQVKFSAETDDYDGDVMWVNPADDHIELGQYIYESIVLGLPYSRVHGDDAEGNSLCNADMLARFKTLLPEDLDMLAGESETALASNPKLEQLRGLMNRPKD